MGVDQAEHVAALRKVETEALHAGSLLREIHSARAAEGDGQLVHEPARLAEPIALGRLPDLRGVRGEMLSLETGEIKLSRPIRLLHPRHPIYIVPREKNRFMVGATMIESADAGPITARSLMELLNAAYALHPAFGEARLTETGAGVRPAYPDNLPRVTQDGRTIHVNGLYRHGFLLAPAMAGEVARLLCAEQKQTERRAS